MGRETKIGTEDARHLAAKQNVEKPENGSLMNAEPALERDLPEILALQRLAFECEARALNDWTIQPMTETLEELRQEFFAGPVLKICEPENGRIIASIRAHEENGTLHLAKLIVHPEFRRRGLASRLLREIQTRIPHRRIELFTRADNAGNVALYLSAGFRIFLEKDFTENLRMAYFEKTAEETDALE